MKLKQYILLVSMMIVLSGCLYPDERLVQNRVPYKDQIQSVQSAVSQFKEEQNGLLPIKTRESDTPIYQKYPIDFNKVAPRYIQEPPGSAFESGGTFQYVLVNVEDDPTVKLIDLLTVEPIRDLKLRLNFYRSQHIYPPYKDTLADGYYTLDYEKLGYDKDIPFVVSPFTHNNLSLFIDTEGEIYIDYSPDLYEYLQKYEHNLKPGDDIRNILVENSDFVPAFSVPYTVEKGEPIFLTTK